MTSSHNKELDRQYRVLRQTLGIHGILHDRYAWRARAMEIAIMLASVVFCATTFAGDDLYTFIGVSATGGRIALGVASVIAFGGSLVLLVVDWEKRSEQHGQAVRQWSLVLRMFRDAWCQDHTWLDERQADLTRAYWAACQDTIGIPSTRFVRLKSEHLLRVEISKFKDKYPGCPRFVIWLILRISGTYKAIRDLTGGGDAVSARTEGAAMEDFTAADCGEPK